MRNNMMLRATIRASRSQRPISIHEIWNSILFKCYHQYIVRYERNGEIPQRKYIMAGNLWMPLAMLCKNVRRLANIRHRRYLHRKIKERITITVLILNETFNTHMCTLSICFSLRFHPNFEEKKQSAQRRLHSILFTFAFVSFFFWIIGWCGGCAHRSLSFNTEKCFSANKRIKRMEISGGGCVAHHIFASINLVLSHLIYPFSCYCFCFETWNSFLNRAEKRKWTCFVSVVLMCLAHERD